MTSEITLLQEYAATGAQPAFAELARRYVDLVYSSARRQLHGDGHQAEDVAQAVFLVLAQRAKSVPTDRPLSAWLLKVTSYCCANARRAHQRRGEHERRAAEMARMSTDDSREHEPDWEALSPLLDHGLAKLPAADRDALLLRFLEHKSMRQVGEALGISEDAAQKRVTRAVDKLRDFFQRRGIATLSAVSLTTLLTAKTVEAAPAGLAATVATPAAGATSAAALAKGAIFTMATQKAVTTAAVAAALLLAIGGGVVAVKSVMAPVSARTVRVVSTPSPTTVGATSQPANGVRFADGTMIEILGFSEEPPPGPSNWLADLVGAPPPTSDATSWWTPDGKTTAPPQFKQVGHISVGHMPGRREIRIVYVTSGPSAGSASPALSVANGNNNAQTSWQINGERVAHSVYSVPANLDHTELSMGLAAGPFREAASRSYASTAPVTKRSGPAIFGELHDEGGTCFVDIDQTKWPSGDWRIEAILSDGKRVASSSYRSTGQNDATATFPCRKDQVVRIAWMQRDYQWQSIGQVPLRAPATAPTTQVASGGNDGSITGKGP